MLFDYDTTGFRQTCIKCPGILHCPKTFPTLNSSSMPVNRSLVRKRVRSHPTHSAPLYNNAHKRPNPPRCLTNILSPPCHNMHSTSKRDIRTPSSRTMCMCRTSSNPPKGRRNCTLPPRSASTRAESGCRMLRPGRAKIATPALGG